MLLIPYGHDQGILRLPFLTGAIILTCLATHIYSLKASASEADLYGVVPDGVGGELSDDQIDELADKYTWFQWGFIPLRRASATWITHQFLHGGWLHLGFNMLFLWLCGCNIEDRWGRLVFPAVYLVGGAGGALAFGALHPESTAPLIGASGAISALMGAFLVCFYRAHLRIAYVLIFPRPMAGTFGIPAFVALPMWFVEQSWSAWMEAEGGAMGVAFSAHVGGFLIGAVVALALKLSGVEKYLLTKRDDAVGGPTFEEDPRFVEAMTLAASGKGEEQRKLLEEIRRDNPSHDGASIELCRLAIADSDASKLPVLLERAIVSCLRRGDASGGIELWKQASSLKWTPDDRAHLAAARAFEEAGLASDALDTLNRLIRSHRESPLLPRGLLEAARIQEETLKNLPGAKVILETLVRSYPNNPFGQEARARLEKIG